MTKAKIQFYLVKVLISLWLTFQAYILTAQTSTTRNPLIACDALPPDSCITLISQQSPQAEKWQSSYLAATYFLHQNQFEKSLEAFTLCLKSAAEASDSLFALIYNDMGICADESGLYQIANQYYMEGISFAKKTTDSLLLLSQIYSNLGILHTKTWNTQTASFYQKKALEIDQKILSPTDPWIESDQFNLARTLRLLGDHQAEIGLLKTILNRRKKRQAEPQSISNVLINLSVAYRQLNQLDTALDYVYQAILMDQQVKDNHALLFNDFYNKGLIYLQAQQGAEALEAVTSISQFISADDDAANSQLILVQAQVQELLGRREIANSLYEKAYKYRLLQTLNHGTDQLAEYLECTHLWTKYLAEDNPQVAYKLIKEANQVFNLTTYSKANIEAFARIYQHNKAWFNFMLNFIFDLYQKSNNTQYLIDLVRLIEVNHEIAIKDAYVSSEQPLMKVPDETQKIGQALLDIKSKIAFLSENAEHFQDSIRKLTSLEYDLSIQWHLALSVVESPTLYSSNGTPTDMHDAKAWCATYSETIISYYLADSALFIAVINKDTSAVLKQQLSQSQLSLVIDSISEGIESFGTLLLHSEEEIRGALALFNRSSHYLYRSLVEPARNLLTKNVTIIPDGIIFNVPFSCLTPKEHNQASWTAESFLINAYNLSFNYSLQSIGQAEPSLIGEPVNFIAPFRTLASSNPTFYLPASEEEYQKVAKALRVKSVDPNSTKSDIKLFFKDNAIIHMATHAFSESSKPAGYYLCINQNPTSFTGRLYLHEIYGSTFDAGLLVLNACQTAKTTNASLSLSRAFFAAGTTHLISTQWKIADETHLDITGDIYQRIMVSDHLGECLAWVKRKYLQNHSGIRLHPYYWDGHQAWGSGSVKLISSAGFSRLGWVLGLLLIVCCWVYYKKKRVVQ